MLPAAEAVMRRGFTLIELLVVIGIIAILASLLLPVVGLVRTMARTSVCASSQRQVGMGMMAFSIDNRGLMPRTRSSGGQGWIGTISPYVESAADDDSQRANDGASVGAASRAAKRDILWGCPEWAANKLRLEYASGGIFFYNGFGMNAWLAATSTGTAAQNGKHNFFDDLRSGMISIYPASDFRRATITYPSTRPLVRDSGEDWIGNHGLGGFDTSTVSDPWPYMQNIRDPRHRGRYNVLYCDGRVASATDEGCSTAVVAPDLAQP